MKTFTFSSSVKMTNISIFSAGRLHDAAVLGTHPRFTNATFLIMIKIRVKESREVIINETAYPEGITNGVMTKKP